MNGLISNLDDTIKNSIKNFEETYIASCGEDRSFFTLKLFEILETSTDDNAKLRALSMLLEIDN